MKKVAISACLLGENVRYDGSNKANKQIIELIKNHNIISICPEKILKIPHSPIEIRNNHAINKDNEDLTDILTRSCLKEFERIKDCDFAILKSKSPTCGYKKIYDGSFSNSLIDGNGLFTKLLLENNIKVFTELQIEEIKKELSK